MRSALYSGLVQHRRFSPRAHQLRYRVFMLLVDLDELETLDRSLKIFALNKPALFAHYDRDHADGAGGPLRPHIERRLAEAGLEIKGGRIALLAMPRMLGFVFNPLSVYFCYDAEENLAAIVYEVKNTFGERHDYVLPVRTRENTLSQSCDKAFFVSPFLHMDLRYVFEISPPDEAVGVAMRVVDSTGRLVLTASFAGAADPLTDRNLLRALARHPFMTLGAVAAIHWEALKLLAKGVPFLGRRLSGAQPDRAHAPRQASATQ